MTTTIPSGVDFSDSFPGRVAPTLLDAALHNLIYRAHDLQLAEMQGHASSRQRDSLRTARNRAAQAIATFTDAILDDPTP
jgi:hypothetical protein